MASGRNYRSAREKVLAEATHCTYCGCEISDDLPPNYIRTKDVNGVPIGVGKATTDHIITLADGGPDTVENLAPACLECNLARGTKDPGWNDPMVPGYEDW